MSINQNPIDIQQKIAQLEQELNKAERLAPHGVNSINNLKEHVRQYKEYMASGAQYGYVSLIPPNASPDVARMAELQQNSKAQKEELELLRAQQMALHEDQKRFLHGLHSRNPIVRQGPQRNIFDQQDDPMRAFVLMHLK